MPLIKLIGLWLILVVTVPLVLVFAGLPERWGVWAGIGVVFSAISHISQSPYWQYFRHKELNPFSKGFGTSSVPKPVAVVREKRSLDTPIKRAWFIVFLFGAAVCLLTFLVYQLDDNYKGFVDAMLTGSSRYNGYRVSMAVGFAMTSFGYLFSFRYEQTLGKLITWIKFGSAP